MLVSYVNGRGLGLSLQGSVMGVGHFAAMTGVALTVLPGFILMVLFDLELVLAQCHQSCRKARVSPISGRFATQHVAP
jgi:hypothetical protein